MPPDIADTAGAAAAQDDPGEAPTAASDPFSVTPEVGIVVIWMVVPLAAGYARFDRVDL